MPSAEQSGRRAARATAGRRTMVIGRPVLETGAGRARAVAQVDVAGETRALWFEVETAYAPYLNVARGDAFLVGLLYTALHEGYDLVSVAPVTAELLHNLTETLVPAVVKAEPGLVAPAISAPAATAPLVTAGKVGTGISCGVDSLQAVHAYGKGRGGAHEITHLVIFNVGAYKKGREAQQFAWQRRQARAFAAEYGYALVEADSNLHAAFPRDHALAVKYSNAFAIHMLAKLWGVYLYASDGYDFRDCRLSEYAVEDSAWMDALGAIAFTTRTLQVVPAGFALTRWDKLAQLADDAAAQKYLDCCFQAGAGSANGFPNCGRCSKCRRTILLLDALGALDRFARVFDVKDYRAHRDEYDYWLLSQRWLRHGDAMAQAALAALKPRMARRLFVKSFLGRLKHKILGDGR